MGRLRSLVRRSWRRVFSSAVKPAAAVAVVGILSLSLVVSTPSNAQAFVTPPPVLPSVFGATEMVLPEVMAGEAAAGPIGWGPLAATAGLALGLTIYETRDTWWPWVAGAFGQGQSNSSPAASGASVWAGLSIGSISLSSSYPYAVDVQMSYSGSAHPNGDNFTLGGRVACSKNGVVSYTNLNVIGFFGNQGSFYTSSPRPSLACPDHSATIVGAEAGAPLSSADITSCPSNCYPGPTNFMQWGIDDHSSSPFDPHSANTHYVTTVECISDTGVKTSVSRGWTGDSPGMVMPSCEAAGLGHGDGAISVTGTNPNTGLQTPLWSAPATAPDTTHPLCGPNIPGPGCKLQVLVDGKPCLVGQWDCVNWKRLDQSRVECWYGPYQVDISECNALERAYTGTGAPITGPNVDGNPDTADNLDLNGQPAPNAAPGGGEATSTEPGTTTTTVPGGAGAPDPAASGSDTQQCFPLGWQVFNPMWIVDGIKCAFEPKKDIKVRVTTLQATAQGKAPISWLMTTPSGPGGGGCPNWNIKVLSFSWSAVCDSSFTAAIVGSRGLIFAMLSVAMVWPLIRSLWYAAIPILRVTPSSGGK